MAEQSGVSEPRPGLLGRFARWLWQPRPGRGRQARRRPRPGARDHAVRPRARAQRGRRLDRRRDRAAARVRAAHQQHRPRAADLRLAAGGRGVHDPGGAARRSHQAHAAAGDQHRPLEHGLAVQRVRGQLLEPAADEARARRGGGDRGAGDRVADRRLLPGQRTRGRSGPTSSSARPRGRPSASSSAASWRACSTGRRRSWCCRSRASSWRGSCGGPCPEPLRGGQSHLEVGTTDLDVALSQADGAGAAWRAPAQAGATRARSRPRPAGGPRSGRTRGGGSEPRDGPARGPQPDGAVAVGALPVRNPLEPPDDLRLLAGLLLLRRPVHVRAAVRQGPLPRQPGRSRARAGAAGRGRA